jgi:copper(I)-binding protein
LAHYPLPPFILITGLTMKNKLLLAVMLSITPMTFAEIVVTDVWARETVPGTNSSAMFATLQNTTRKPTQLVSVQVTGVEKAELHTHNQDGGMMRMRRVTSIDVGARTSVTLAPGGFHVMLFQLKKPLRAGSNVPVVFNFSNGEKVEAVAQVMGMGQSLPGKSADKGASDHHH